jgi:putative pyrroloquinoline-quinone-binding quinoprotein
VGRDGTIYLGTFNGEMVALRRNGTLKWALPATDSVNATLAILLDGRIAFVDEGGPISVVNPTGSLSWRYETGTGFSSPSGAPAVGRDGTIYTGIDETVYALNPDGSVRWIYPTGRLGTAVAVGNDGRVYFAPPAC